MTSFLTPSQLIKAYRTVTLSRLRLISFVIAFLIPSISFSQSIDLRDLDAAAQFKKLALSYSSEEDVSIKKDILLQMEPLAYAGVDKAARFLAGHSDYKDQRFGWLYLSSLTGNAISEFEIAQLFLSSNNEEEALRWLKKALNNQASVAADTTRAALAMGTMIEWSIVRFGVKGDFSTALGWYALAAKDSHPSALYALGRASLTGQGIQQDTQGARDLLVAAADLNSTQAAELLALLQQI